MTAKAAIQHIERQGALLVYPIDNAKEPPSLWSSFFPRSQMRWEWDADGDDRVGKLWHLKTELSGSGKVVYAKWYRGRATFLSKELATAMMAAMGTSREPKRGLGREARTILETLSLDSPLSTKQLKSATDLRGKAYEGVYERALKELWQRLLIVGFGEFEDGAFPSLAVGSTQLLFEDLWNASQEMAREEGLGAVRRILPDDSLFLKQLTKYIGKESGKDTKLNERSS